MAVSLNDIMSTLQNGVTAIQRVATQLGNVFPQAGATSTSATTGAATLTSSQPALFLTVLTSSGGSYKVALYNS